MNYLAHACLSFNHPEILIGNMISDFVKGKKQFEYTEAIRKGITLHRMIDNYTDQHPATRVAKNFFKPQYRLYAGAFVDVVYDHFLALNENEFKTYGGLQQFSLEVYEVLETNILALPEIFRAMFPSMKHHNWLYNYQYKEGIRRSFGGLAFRAAYLTESAKAFEIFLNNYTELQKCFEIFFPEVKSYALNNLRNLLPV
ncbi:acyl carrier protein phosphodiesterase [soil metagenome]